MARMLCLDNTAVIFPKHVPVDPVCAALTASMAAARAEKQEAKRVKKEAKKDQ